MTPAEEKQFLADAEADAVERMAQLERELGPDFDPRRVELDEDDRAHIAFLLMRDRCEALRLERDAFDAAVGEHKRVIAQKQADIDHLARALFSARMSIEHVAEQWWPPRARLRSIAQRIAGKLEPYFERVMVRGTEDLLAAIRGLRDEERVP